MKVKKGEIRSPGEAYERMYGLEEQMEEAMQLNIGGSLIGYDVQTMIDHWLHRDDIKDAAFQDRLDTGTDLHKEKEAEFKELGVAISSEQYVKDEENRISGFYDMEADNARLIQWAMENNATMEYYRAAPGGGDDQYLGYYSSPVQVNSEIASDIISRSPTSIVDIKTRGQNQYDRAELHFENAQQVNFYGSQMGTGVNAVIEYNQDDPEARPHVFFFDYNPYLYQHTTEKVEVARQAVYQMLEDGAIGRGDLYNHIDRYRILADVAPYSEEFRKMKAQLSLIDLTDEEREEVRIINEQVSTRKDHVPTYDYRFQTANVKNMTVTVTDVIDNNTFLTKEFSDNPIRLAGVYVPTGQDEEGQAATEFVRRYIREGHKLTISVNADEMNLVNNDTYNTISAVVRAGDIKNLNREMIEKGLAKEKENDWSATGVRARFSDTQIGIGKAWETIAHLDTPINTKLLHVASPLEEYTRREVYGRRNNVPALLQDWVDPLHLIAV